MIKAPLLSPNPQPMPTTPPGVAPAPPLPPSQPQQPPGAAGAGGAPQAGAGADPTAQADPNAGAQGAPDASTGAQAGQPSPRLIPGSDATSGDVPASPEEQSDLEQTLVKAGNMIHDRQSRNQVLSQMHDPRATVAQAVGRTTASILMQIDGQRQATGRGPLDRDVLMEAARYVVPELMDVGISAGLFPLKPTASPGEYGQQGVGVGTDPYNKEVRMALLEASKIYGEQILHGPNAHAETQQAQNDWAAGVRREVDEGTANPRFLAMTRPQSGGQPALIDQDNQSAAPGPGGQGATSDQAGASNGA